MIAGGGGSDYTIDHSAFLYLMDRDGRFIGFLPPGTSADRIAETLRGIAAHTPSHGR
jgi:cytochrome oxidase Cu insertion factor (SCO1/SenC/PrrC family)